MFVSDLMIKKVVTVLPDVNAHEAIDLMREKKIRHLPVVDEAGQLVGIVTDKNLTSVVPSSTTSLTAREMNYILTKLKVKDVMSREVITTTPDTPLEEAAAILSDNKISGLPVMSDGKLIGIITDTDVFKVFTYLLGARRSGIRMTALIPGIKGTLARLTAVIFAAGGDILTFSEYQDDKGQWHLTLKVVDISRERLVQALEGVVEKIVDVRDSPAIKPE
jgi:acetoin utilization protein AcuB